MIDFDFIDEAKPAIKLYDYQIECIEAVRAGWNDASRQLIVVSGGAGKTIIFSFIAKEFVDRGEKVLILCHTEELIEQARDKLFRSTGIEAEKEKAEESASPYAMVVVASVQTLARINRLTGFSDSHFGLVVVDEAHRGLSDSHLRVKNYFHFGVESLAEGWIPPEPGVPYTPKAKILGVTATPSRGDKRSLGEFYQRIAFEYTLLDAVRDGRLVRPMVKNIPLQIDMRGVKTSRSAQGADYDAHEVSERMEPIIAEVAKQLALAARDLKTVVFTPSIKTAQMLASALCVEGMNASFVSGACPNREEKIEAFRRAGPGSILANALLVVEGFDVPDITGVCILRPTKIWSFFVQAAVRGTRTLTGLIDGLKTKEERLAAIAASAKPCFYIIDFLWLTDTHSLIEPVDLVAGRPEVRERMKGDDLVAAQAEAERDFLKSLAQAARKHARKAARVIDPLAWAVSLGDAKLATWEPQTKWEEEPATTGQLEFIRKQGMSIEGIRFKGLASKIITLLITRMKLRLATASQLDFLAKLGFDEQKAATMTVKEATATIDAILKAKKERASAATNCAHVSL